MAASSRPPRLAGAPARELRIDFTGARSKDAMLQVAAKALKLPRHFGMNLDALHDCLTDLAIPAGTCVMLVKLAHTPAGDAVHGVFRAAARHWARQARTGPGPGAGRKVTLMRPR